MAFSSLLHHFAQVLLAYWYMLRYQARSLPRSMQPDHWPTWQPRKQHVQSCCAKEQQRCWLRY
jgi:hypothetical protein